METYVSALYEGTFSVGLDQKFVRIGRDDKPAKGTLKLSLNPFLIRTTDRNYLFDCGIGEFGEDTGPDTIRENLETHGLTEYDITDIFLSHLHFDHIGGLAHRENGYWELTFPDAKVWVSRKGWNKLKANEDSYEEDQFDFISFIDARADLNFLHDEHQPYADMTVRKIGGHTEFHQLLLFNDGEHKYMQAGDVIGTKGSVNRKYAAKYDFEPKLSQRNRAELTELAYKKGYVILAYHDYQHPIFKLTDYKHKTGYHTENIESYVPA
ncbi:MAG: MBL fold metallo-hydrolase [Gracilimonas sp.]